MATMLLTLGVFALIAGVLFRYPHIGMLVHPDGQHPVRRASAIRFFRSRFNMTAQSFLAAGAGMLTLGLALL